MSTQKPNNQQIVHYLKQHMEFKRTLIRITETEIKNLQRDIEEFGKIEPEEIFQDNDKKADEIA